MRFVTNPTPVEYPKIDYDVEGNNKFPNLDKLIENKFNDYSKHLMKFTNYINWSTRFERN